MNLKYYNRMNTQKLEELQKFWENRKSTHNGITRMMAIYLVLSDRKNQLQVIY